MILLFKLLRRLLLPAVIVVAFFLAPAIGAVNGRTLHTSVARQVGGDLSFGPRACTRGGGAWRCDVLAYQGDSNGTTYTVRKRGRRCWTARATRPTGELPALARGCAKLREQGRVGRWVSEVVG